MRSAILPSLLLTCLCAAPAAVADEPTPIRLADVPLPPEVGAEVALPDIPLPAVDGGEPRSLADLHGRRYILHVFASW